MSAVDAMSDRVCIHSKGIHNFRFSASNLINCCFQCGKGCFGGVEKAAWNYWIKFGIVSGGLYKSEQVLFFIVKGHNLKYVVTTSNSQTIKN